MEETNKIREANQSDLESLLTLYMHLHEISVPQIDERALKTWDKILSDEDYHLIVAEVDGLIVASCTCIIVPNLTRGILPYALVENVVTHSEYRGRGIAKACMDFAEEIAIRNDCYKMMLITGSNNPGTHEFYKKSGYFSEGKTAYYKLLKEVNWKH